MASNGADHFRIDPGELTAAIRAYRAAADEVAELSNDVFRYGQIELPWAEDEVSRNIAEHYNATIFDGNYSTSAAIRQYEGALRETIRTLEQMLSSYQESDLNAAAVLAGKRV